MANFIGTFNVIPSLPQNLERLRELAYNLYWTWSQDAFELFRRLDRELWDSTGHNPVMMLGKISQDRLLEVANDDGFIAHMNRAYDNLKSYLSSPTWFQKNFKSNGTKPYIAYFSAEFGLTECLQIYSGGLGILAGDHLKSASELGLPLVGVGLLYKEGYFQQYLTSDGWQQERYEINDFYNLPMTLLMDENKKPVKVRLNFPNRTVHFQIWRIDVGRIPLFLMDTNVPENNDEDRKITRTLYGGNAETRIQQELILGIGGLRALHTLGIKPQVCHMNEGHSAFLSLERIRYIMSTEGLSFAEAKELGYASNIFTTHTPVPAGIDVFSNDLMEKYFGSYYRTELKIQDREFYRLGTLDKDAPLINFNMAHLAMNTSGYVNGVSKLHSEVSKKMWVSGFKGVPFEEIPIDYVTNGVHTRSHISNDMVELLFRYLGDKFIQKPEDQSIWVRVDKIPDVELWRTHERRRERLVAFARSRLRKQVLARGGSHSEIASANEVLDPGALTIGFARRFATYKRANLIFTDRDRLANILNNPLHPVQLIIAGKAHPKDEEGKKFIQEIVQIAKEDQFRKKIVFLENYDMNVARYMVEGCDVWLNNPRRPLEASGTSGMKVIANGGLNFSILDGWWDEGYDPEVGWKIGNGEEYLDVDYQNEVESRELYDTLETEIVATFYNRSSDKLPRLWISKMKSSMKKLGPVFNTNRMVEQYFVKFYNRAFENRKALMKNSCQQVKTLTEWKKKVRDNWNQVKFVSLVSEGTSTDVKVGTEFFVRAEINLGGLTPDDVEVQIYFGSVDRQNIAHANSFVTMQNEKGKARNNVYIYRGAIVSQQSGQFGFTARVLPKHPLLNSSFDMGLIAWA
ncbi:MAG: glycosyltransferase family 1 protein [Ignavibacteria bacterium]|jgi:starch phosphorylase|nr:glycosyltransferase family 1 protein [Ignavibacteria bacterium]MCU7497896.1 glycosyltransferase family 1 protein [Ignavibacteria bacterium]MCU7511177.1 glycosyltransferase family 1 protein [Ignavibacteria bacterium]MCU7518723.1 glycosyltransferase family 1 protein [Ignavibacteria bacterium]MCU7522874.1 glycosyltransferase family 1 protein [Ignavibacteria bacterium]